MLIPRQGVSPRIDRLMGRFIAPKPVGGKRDPSKNGISLKREDSATALHILLLVVYCATGVFAVVGESLNRLQDS